jgi:ACR3 family arsenite transporter
MSQRPAADAATSQVDPVEADVLHRLSTLDRFLPLWILLAMAAGLLLGWAWPGIQDVLDAVKIGRTSLPIAIGLLLMMYPVLAKVHYEDMSRVTGDKPMLWSSLLLNWVIGPALMFTLAWVFLADYPEFRTGLIVIGLARCIAMVLIWNDLACGDREAAALLVAINSVFQVLGYALLGTFYLEILPGWLGLPTEDVTFSTVDITTSVLVFLGIPLALGYATRRILRPRRGADWYDHRFLPRIGPWALYGLLFTIVVMFALQGEAILNDPWSVALIAVPLLCYFAIMWSVSFVVGRRTRMPYPKTATLAFTAAGNNFELAIAVSIGVWGVTSGQALAGVIGPLIEVPALVGLVYVSLWLRRRLAWRR